MNIRNQTGPVPIKLSLLSKSLLVARGLVVMVIVLALFILVLFLNAEEKQSENVQTMINVYQASQAEVLTMFELLTKSHYTCNDEDLLNLRALKDGAWYALDISMFEDGRVICNTSAGFLKQPYRINRAPDLVTSDSIKVFLNWPVKHPVLSKTYSSSMYLMKGNFGIFLDPRKLDIAAPEDEKYLFYFQGGGDPIFILGEQDAFLESKKVGFSLGRTDLIYKSCSEDAGYCALGLKSYMAVLRDSEQFLPFVFILALALGFATIAISRSRMLAYYSLEQRVLRGLSKGLFYPVFQPIVELQSRRIVACEMLARYKDGFGAISPDEFIGVIRRHGKTVEFTRNMIENMVSAVAGAGGLPEGFAISLNVFPRDIESGSIHGILEGIDFSRLDCRISLEITEDECLDAPSAQKELSRLSDAGFRISIDDFGTGYSNLGQLKKMPCDYLKIDRSFVQDIDTEGIKSSLIPNIVDMAKQFGLKIIAEGIESEHEAKVLQELAVLYGQGYLFGRPMALENLKKAIAESRSRTDQQPGSQDMQSLSA